MLAFNVPSSTNTKAPPDNSAGWSSGVALVNTQGFDPSPKVVKVYIPFCVRVVWSLTKILSFKFVAVLSKVNVPFDVLVKVAPRHIRMRKAILS